MSELVKVTAVGSLRSYISELLDGIDTGWRDFEGDARQAVFAKLPKNKEIMGPALERYKSEYAEQNNGDTNVQLQPAQIHNVKKELAGFTTEPKFTISQIVEMVKQGENSDAKIEKRMKLLEQMEQDEDDDFGMSKQQRDALDDWRSRKQIYAELMPAISAALSSNGSGNVVTHSKKEKAKSS